ncbi:hypothetical protein D3C80_1991330 [compost metagenome]
MLVRMRPLEGLLAVYGPGFLLKPHRVKKAGGIVVNKIRIGDVFAIEERLFHGFNQEMVSRCA